MMSCKKLLLIFITIATFPAIFVVASASLCSKRLANKSEVQKLNHELDVWVAFAERLQDEKRSLKKKIKDLAMKNREPLGPQHVGMTMMVHHEGLDGFNGDGLEMKIKEVGELWCVLEFQGKDILSVTPKALVSEIVED